MKACRVSASSPGQRSGLIRTLGSPCMACSSGTENRPCTQAKTELFMHGTNNSARLRLTQGDECIAG